MLSNELLAFSSLILTDQDYFKDHRQKLIWLLILEVGPKHRFEVYKLLNNQSPNIIIDKKVEKEEITFIITLKNSKELENLIPDLFNSRVNKDKIQLKLKFFRSFPKEVEIFNDYHKNKYKGSFDNLNKPCGKGTYFYDDGRKYEGFFSSGMKHGEGRLDFIDGTYYEGRFEKDLMNEKGIIMWKNGRKFVGCFKQGGIKGYGSYLVPGEGPLGDRTFYGFWESHKSMVYTEEDPNNFMNWMECDKIKEFEDDALRIKGYQYPKEGSQQNHLYPENDDSLLGDNLEIVSRFLASNSNETMDKTSTTQSRGTGTGNNTIGDGDKIIGKRSHTSIDEEIKGEITIEQMHKKAKLVQRKSSSQNNIIADNPGPLNDYDMHSQNENVLMKQIPESSNANDDTINNININIYNNAQSNSKTPQSQGLDSPVEIEHTSFPAPSYHMYPREPDFHSPQKKKIRNSKNSIPNKSRKNTANKTSASDYSIKTENSSHLDIVTSSPESIFISEPSGVENPVILPGTSNVLRDLKKTKGADLAICKKVEPKAVDMLGGPILSQVQNDTSSGADWVENCILAVKKLRKYLFDDYHSKRYKKSTVKKLRLMFAKLKDMSKEILFKQIYEVRLDQYDSLNEQLRDERILANDLTDRNEFKSALDAVILLLSESLKQHLQIFKKELMDKKNKYASHHYQKDENNTKRKQGLKIDLIDEQLILQRKIASWKHVMNSVGVEIEGGVDTN